MSFWNRFIESLTRAGFLNKQINSPYLSTLELCPIKPAALYSRYDVAPQAWLTEQSLAKLSQGKSAASLPESLLLEYLTLSKKRKNEHSKIFQKKPLKCSKLTGVSSSRINQIIEDIANDPKGPFVIPTIIDHWTTLANLRSILSQNAILGNLSLTENNITFVKNALNECDVKNGDADVICFSSGGFVDYNALHGNDRVRVRIDATKLHNVKYNTFFKAVDLCVPSFSVEVQLTKELKVIISHSNTPKLFFTFILNDKEKSCSVTSELEKDQLIFYGNILEINKAALMLPFLALEIGQNKPAINTIYDHLHSLDDSNLRKVLVALAQNATLYSELNVYSKLFLTPHLIYDIHVASEKATYPLYHLSSAEEYERLLNSIVNSNPEDRVQADKDLEPIDILSHQRGMVILYGRWIQGHLDKHQEKVDITEIPTALFNDSYLETRPGIRKAY